MALLLASASDVASEQERNDLLAIEALREESALELKEQGNVLVKKGKHQEGVECYTRAIDLRYDDVLLNSVLYSNRAHANLVLGNYRHALDDAQAAIRLNAWNLKAHFRGAKAALALDLFGEAMSLCVAALEKEPSNSELEVLKRQLEAKRKAEEDAEKERKMQLKRKEELVAALEQRRVKLGPPFYKRLSGGKRPWLDSSGVLHWPVVFLYGETMSSDVIEDFSEFDRFATHLQTVSFFFPFGQLHFPVYSTKQQMFGDSSLPWDEKHEYTLDRIELYYQANAVTPLPREEIVSDGFDIIEDNCFGDSKLVKIRNNSMLKDVLAQPEFVVPGIPVFYVVAAGTKFREMFLSGAWSPP